MLEDLTGIENIERETRLLRVAAASREDFVRTVIAFSELGKFANVPVRRYSSGMRLRLSIAIALFSSADVLFLGDVLGVSDIAFKQRCLARLQELLDANAIVVTTDPEPSLPATRLIEFDRGRIVFDSISGFNRTSLAERYQLSLGSALPENDYAALADVSATPFIENSHEQLRVSMRWRIKRGPLKARPAIDLRAGRVRVYRSVAPSSLPLCAGNELSCAVDIPLDMLRGGHYVVDGILASSFGGMPTTLKAPRSVQLRIRGREATGWEPTSRGCLELGLDWQCQKVAELAT